MYYITKTFKFEAGHRLMNYSGKCSNLHGHNYEIEVSLGTEDLDDTGFVMDFADLKKELAPIFEEIDHAMILCKDDIMLIEMLQYAKQKLYILDYNPTAEHIARHLYNILLEQRYPVSLVTVKETPTSVASYSL